MWKGDNKMKTTKEKIEIMKTDDRGEQIEFKNKIADFEY